MTSFADLLPSNVAVAEDSEPSTWGTGLMPRERELIASAVPRRKLEFAAGRMCARRALAQLGIPECEILVGPGRAPIFPLGISGTITHTDAYCAAAAVLVGKIQSVGIDAESSGPLDRDLLDLIALPVERQKLSALASQGVCDGPKILFSAKEAFFKAYFQICPRYLDFHDAEITLTPANHSFTVRVLVNDAPDYFKLSQFVGSYRRDDNLIRTAICLVR